jgi:hypothetical protein
MLIDSRWAIQWRILPYELQLCFLFLQIASSPYALAQRHYKCVISRGGATECDTFVVTNIRKRVKWVKKTNGIIGADSDSKLTRRDEAGTIDQQTSHDSHHPRSGSRRHVNHGRLLLSFWDLLQCRFLELDGCGRMTGRNDSPGTFIENPDIFREARSTNKPVMAVILDPGGT